MTTLDICTEFLLIDGIPVYPIFGSETGGGFHTEGDVLVDRTADGVPPRPCATLTAQTMLTKARHLTSLEIPADKRSEIMC